MGGSITVRLFPMPCCSPTLLIDPISSGWEPSSSSLDRGKGKTPAYSLVDPSSSPDDEPSSSEPDAPGSPTPAQQNLIICTWCEKPFPPHPSEELLQLHHQYMLGTEHNGRMMSGIIRLCHMHASESALDSVSLEAWPQLNNDDWVAFVKRVLHLVDTGIIQGWVNGLRDHPDAGAILNRCASQGTAKPGFHARVRNGVGLTDHRTG